MAGDARSETGGERVSAGEVRVDLREALSGGSGFGNGAPRPTPPPRPDPELPQGAGERDDLLITELLPADVYRIVDGREVKDTTWTRLVARTKDLLTSPPAKQEEHLDRELRQLRVRGLA